MSTYAIADAIKNFSKDLKEVISEKNKIEKEKLAFEKEKFEFSKQRFNNKQQSESNSKRNTKCNDEAVCCNHNWQYKSTEFDQVNMCYVKRYVCGYCGEIKKEEVECISTQLKT